MPAIPTEFVQRLRELIPTWRSPSIGDEDTFAAYGSGRLQVNIEIEDRAAQLAIGCLRADLTDAGWVAGWVSPELATSGSFEDAAPVERVNGAASDVESAAAGLPANWSGRSRDTSGSVVGNWTPNCGAWTTPDGPW